MLWKHHTNGVVRSSPAVGNGKIVFGSYDNAVYCLGDKSVEDPKPPADPPKPDPDPTPPPAPEKKTIKLEFWIGKTEYTVDGETKNMTVAPTIIGGSTLMPARYLVEGIGGTVSWDAKEKMAECKTDKNTLKLWVGKNTANLDGVDIVIHKSQPGITPVIRTGRVFLPFRFLCESLGCEVGWDDSDKRINITYRY